MSFIRSGSNPEALYIWGGARDGVNISHSLLPPFANRWPDDTYPPSFVVPWTPFRLTCLSWLNGADRTSRAGLLVEEIHIFLETGERVPKTWGIKQMLRDNRRTAFMVRLTYKKNFFYMWPVTWMYVVKNVCAGVCAGMTVPRRA
jgi:hypothetical protein